MQAWLVFVVEAVAAVVALGTGAGFSGLRSRVGAKRYCNSFLALFIDGGLIIIGIYFGMRTMWH